MAATIKYFDYTDGIYVENPDGPLMGIQWADAGGNQIRAVLFLMDFSTLMNGQEITFIYQAEVQPVGQTDWLLRDRKVFKLTNSVLIDPDDPPHANFRRRVTADAPEAEWVGQLDYFVDIYFKGGKYPPGLLLPMYGWLAEVIADLEGQTIA